MTYDDMNLETQAEAPQQDTELNRLLQSKNIAESLSEEKLNKIGEDCKRGFDIDLESRKDWEQSIDTWMKLAMQVKEQKSFPWNNASNVKYPLISTASMQFSARAYPALVPSDGKVVKSIVIGEDPTGEKQERADRVARYMSYQIMHEMKAWEDDMDKLLIMLPVVGTVFKKTFFNKAENRIESYVVSPKNLVVNYWARCLDTAERISEVIEMPARVLEERKRKKVFLDVDLGQASANDVVDQPIGNKSGINDDGAVPYTLIEQHTFLDLDDDGYTEPYTVTFERKSGEVLKIVARFNHDDVETDEAGKIVAIKPIQYYTKFSFVPNPDGSFYDIGFGILLGPLNESVNTLINQLVDAGTLSNMQSGFIGKGLKIKMGDSRFQPGEWKPVNSTADDLKKQIVPLPAKEPSDVLLKLMEVLINSGKELASVAEIFTGKMPGQNTPATTTMATVEQGMKVFTAVYKRVFRALTNELKLIYQLNATYLDPNTYVAVLDAAVGPDDFNTEDYDVCPSADPNAVSSQEKLQKAMALLELLPLGVLDPIEVITRVLQAQEQPNHEKLFTQQVQQTGQMPPPPPDPKLQEMQMKGQLEQQKIQMQAAAQQQKMELDSRDRQQQMIMKQQEHAQDMAHKEQMAKVQTSAEMHKQRIFSAQAQAEMNQKLVHNEQSHQQKMQQSKEIAKSSQSKTSSTGKQTQSQKPSSKK